MGLNEFKVEDVFVNSGIRIQLKERMKILKLTGKQPAVRQKDNLVVIGKLPRKSPIQIAVDLLNAYTK